MIIILKEKEVFSYGSGNERKPDDCLIRLPGKYDTQFSKDLEMALERHSIKEIKEKRNEL